MKGGYRPGSGRPKGLKDKKPRKPRSDKGKPRKKRTAKKVAKKQVKREVVIETTETPKPNKEIPDDIKKAAENADMTPLEYMLNVMRDDDADDSRRDRMAQAAAPFVHLRMADKGSKKKDRAERAKEAGKGRFAPSAAPKLKAVK